MTVDVDSPSMNDSSTCQCAVCMTKLQRKLVQKKSEYNLLELFIVSRPTCSIQNSQLTTGSVLCL